MKKDLRILGELRKGPLAGMDEDEFKMIEEDVKKFGFKGLSGYAKSTVMRAMRLMGSEINKAVAQRKAELEKHGDHDQSSHGDRYNADDSEGENSSEPKNPKLNFTPYKDDSEGEFEDLDYDDPKYMDTMDLRPRKK